MRVAIRVHPGAGRTQVGGAYGGAEPALVVRVRARAVDGRATEAALRAVADALGVARRRVRLVSGATSRTKVVDVDVDVDGGVEGGAAGAGSEVAARLARLLGK